MDFFQMFGIVVGLISAFTAVVSVIFAWKAVKETQLNNTANLIIQLHALYHSEKIYEAIRRCSEMYKTYKETSENVPLTPQQALEFIKSTEKNPDDWKSVNDLESFWRYIALLVRKRYLDQEIAFSSFSNPEILGFLYPIEKAYNKHIVYDRSLEKLYALYKTWQEPPEPRHKSSKLSTHRPGSGTLINKK